LKYLRKRGFAEKEREKEGGSIISPWHEKGRLPTEWGKGRGKRNLADPSQKRKGGGFFLGKERVLQKEGGGDGNGGGGKRSRTPVTQWRGKCRYKEGEKEDTVRHKRGEG